MHACDMYEHSHLQTYASGLSWPLFGSSLIRGMMLDVIVKVLVNLSPFIFNDNVALQFFVWMCGLISRLAAIRRCCVGLVFTRESLAAATWISLVVDWFNLIYNLIRLISIIDSQADWVSPQLRKSLRISLCGTGRAVGTFARAHARTCGKLCQNFSTRNHWVKEGLRIYGRLCSYTGDKADRLVDHRWWFVPCDMNQLHSDHRMMVDGAWLRATNYGFILGQYWTHRRNANCTAEANR